MPAAGMPLVQGREGSRDETAHRFAVGERSARDGFVVLPRGCRPARSAAEPDPDRGPGDRAVPELYGRSLAHLSPQLYPYPNLQPDPGPSQPDCGPGANLDLRPPAQKPECGRRSRPAPDLSAALG